MTRQIRVNGDPVPVAATTIAALLAEQGIDRTARGVAVAVNGGVVRRTEWDETPVRDGDDIEIVRPFRGG
ncbi:MAG: sulfur carrier protein ThiS [Alphaproteobacteria bacterium]|nr:sulfur carrier protein ThiS [Alphaproteobacteria bacterium]